jgi:hypothetical protein
MNDLLEIHEPTIASEVPVENVSRPAVTAMPEPWSHPWHDQLGLLYHRAIAEKIRRQPSLLHIAKDNLSRWMSAEPEATPSQARREWQLILNSNNIPEIIRLMIDSSEEGHRRRQSTPFAGYLSLEERNALRDQLIEK